MARPEHILNILRLAEDYAQAHNSPRRGGAFAALEKAVTAMAEDTTRLDWIIANMDEVQFRGMPEYPDAAREYINVLRAPAMPDPEIK